MLVVKICIIIFCFKIYQVKTEAALQSMQPLCQQRKSFTTNKA